MDFWFLSHFEFVNPTPGPDFAVNEDSPLSARVFRGWEGLNGTECSIILVPIAGFKKYTTGNEYRRACEVIDNKR